MRAEFFSVRVRPRVLGISLWVALVVLNILDAVTASMFLADVGTAPEANPLIIAVWRAGGAVGLLAFKALVTGVLGLVLAIIATRVALSAMVGLSWFTGWAALSNLQALTPMTPLTGWVFGLHPAIILAGVACLLFYTKMYPRIVDRRAAGRRWLRAGYGAVFDREAATQ